MELTMDNIFNIIQKSYHSYMNGTWLTPKWKVFKPKYLTIYKWLFVFPIAAFLFFAFMQIMIWIANFMTGIADFINYVYWGIGA